MGILDEAIREHLELKRQHGADQSELDKLEDEAFGAPERPGQEAPDSLAEAPTEFLAQPDANAGVAEEAAEAPSARSEGAARIADLQEAPPAPEPEAEPPPAEASEEEPSATEHEIPEPAPSGPSTQEREVIAEQPTEMHDVEEELAEEGPLEGEVVDVEEDEDDDFWDEKRLSDELDQALEAPIEAEAEEEELVKEPEAEEELESSESEPRPAASGDEDVLEETPEFLEQSPEDDELWFEQKPPKDFDFDD
jgi:hypothetical protein